MMRKGTVVEHLVSLSRFKMASSLLAVGLLVAAMNSNASAQSLTVATATQGSLNHVVGSSIARVLGEELGFRARVQPHTGESALLPLVNRGDAELGLAAINQVMGVYDGRDNGRTQHDLRILTTLFPLKVGFFVRADSDIRTIADLKGKRVTHGFTAQGAMIDVVNGLLANGGLTPGDVRTVAVPNVNRGGDDFSAGRVDAFFHAVGAAKVSEVDASVGGLRLLPINVTDEGLQAIQAVFPEGYRHDMQPRDGLVGLKEVTPVLAYDYILVVGAGVDDQKVYEITRALADNKEKLVQGARVLEEMELTRMYVEWPIPTHEGAVRFYEERGVTPVVSR